VRLRAPLLGSYAPQCYYPYHLAVGLTLGRHQGVSVHVHGGRDRGVPHQFLLHPIGAPVESSQDR
jgi:hypothetical protein